MAKNKDFETSTGKGGETHQHVPKKGPHSKPDAHLTTNQGIRVSDNQNSLRAGARAGGHTVGHHELDVSLLLRWVVRMRAVELFATHARLNNVAIGCERLIF